MTLRSLEPIKESNRIKRSPVPPPPKLAWLRVEELVIDEAYQRALSERSVRLIRKLIENWDWNRFKPLSVAPTDDGRYEIVDGQHTAMAAVSHGSIETLPCLVLTADTLQLKAAAFVGINTDRVGLTSYALYRARLAAGDPEAVAVDAGVEMAGADLIEKLQPGRDYRAGTCATVSTLLQLARRGGKARVGRLLKIATAGGVGPVPAALLKGLELITTSPDHPTDERLGAALLSIDEEQLAERVRNVRTRGLALTTAEAWAQAVRGLCAPA